MWEFDDSRAVPTNLVLEQDFILRIRRLQRQGAPYIILNILLSDIPDDYNGRGKIDEAQRRLSAWTNVEGGDFAPMTVGDVFLVWPETDKRSAQEYAEGALSIILTEGGFQDGDIDDYVEIYHLPKDYGNLRERATTYVEMSKHAMVHDDRNSASNLLKSDSARGALTAWSVNQFERLAQEIDLRPYLRTQGVYERIHENEWHPAFEETYMGFQDIKIEHCPHLDLLQPHHLFLELCQILDRALLTFLTPNFETDSDLDISINLSLQSVLGREFARFAYRIPRDKRHKVCFEVHCGDLLQDFTQTLSAFATLHAEGFKIALDGIPPNLVSYMNLANFNFDYYKIDVARTKAMTLDDKKFFEALQKIPRERIIFFHCDSELALAAGHEYGITKFQGWLIDDQIVGVDIDPMAP